MPKEERQGRQTPMITIWSAQGKWAFRFSLMAMRRNLGCVLLCYCLARRNAAALAIRPPNRQRLLLRRSSSHGDDDSTTGTSKATVLHSRNIPKAETKVLDLLERYPTADGRGVKIAILDTGCDLAAAGLQTTSEGKPKYLDFLDCTGDGDIDMSPSSSASATVTVPANNRTVKGLSGRDLIHGDWVENIAPAVANSSTRQVRLGGVRLYKLLPRSVAGRLKRERKAQFERDHMGLIAQTQQQMDDLQRQIVTLGQSKSDDKENDKNDRKSKLIQRRKDTERLLEHYQSLLDSYEDAGPYMDILLFFDGQENVYKAVIDLEATGNLTQTIPMAPYGHARQFETLGFGSEVTFCVQVYDEGKTLSIVTDAGSHGTHVAGIAAANFETKNKTSPKNGVAPGAQILACKIGDGRLGSAETGTGLVRALIAARKYGCHLVNLSYGEPSWQPNVGRVAQTFADAVHKWGMTVFTSAGNDGPALSSLGSPGTLSAPITVGAYVSKEMMVDQYSTLPLNTDGVNEGKLQDSSYYFSSRGPTPDGAFPDLCAPGGAIAPIPRHTLGGKAQYHGTSMSSPNACGVAACVLSALMQEAGFSEACSPAELRRGLVNSAVPVAIADPFAQGAGLISATAAVDYIISHHGKVGQDLTFDVTVPSRENARGIYIRDPLELEGPMTFDVKVLPRFNHALVRTPDEMNELLSLELDLSLTPSKSWVICPERMSLLSAQERNGQTFSVRLATKGLPPGAHFATIDALDASDPTRRPIFQVPVTVIVPHTAAVSPTNPETSLNDDETIWLKDNEIDFSMGYKLEPGAPNRRFLEVPPLAEWATITIRSASFAPSATSPHKVLLHAIPFVRGDLPNTQIQLKKLFVLNEGIEKEFRLRVKGGSTLEVCLQLLWLANPAPVSLLADIEFHSLTSRAPTLVSSQPVWISSAREFARLGVSTPLRSENVKPEAKLDRVYRTIRPTSYDIVGGSSDRDIMPLSDAEAKAELGDGLPSKMGTEIYNMFVKYTFQISSDEPVKVTPSIPSLFNQLYDSPLDSQVWELRDSNSQVLGCGSSMHNSAAVSLSKGNFTLLFHTRHPNRQVLEQVKDVPVQLSVEIGALPCKIYSELDKASTPAVTVDGRQEFGSKVLRKGGFQDLYVARPTGDLPSWAVPGDILMGTVVLDKDKKDVTATPLAYPVPPKSNVKKQNENKLPEAKDDEKSLEEFVFEKKISYLSILRAKDNTTAYKELSRALIEENSTSIPLLSELLSFAKDAKLENASKQARVTEIRRVRDLLSASNGGPIDESELAQYFGVAVPSEDELQEDAEAAKTKKKMESQKQLLQATLLALSDSLGKLASADAAYVEEFDAAVKELKKWVPGTAAFSEGNDKLAMTLNLARHSILCKEASGNAISILMDACKELKSPESYKELMTEVLSIYSSLDGTQHLINHVKNDLHRRFPPRT